MTFARSRNVQRIAAILEVTLVTALTWLAYKAMKLVEPAGFNHSPGLAMLMVSGGLLLLHRRRIDAYGLFTRRWRYGVNLGVMFGSLLLLGAAFEMAILPVADITPTTIPIHTALRIAAIRLPLYLAILLLVTGPACQRALETAPIGFTLPLLAVLLAAAPAMAIHHGGAVGRVIGVTSALVLCTGLGEEMFFRGYVQSRLNGVFGRPWRILTVSLGPGLLVSSALFALIHVLNPARPFHGSWELSWLWGVSTFLSGLLFGWLRDLTGGSWAPAIVHALTGEYRGIWQVFLSNPS